MCVRGNPISEGQYQKRNHPVWSVAAEADLCLHCPHLPKTHVFTRRDLFIYLFIYSFIYLFLDKMEAMMSNILARAGARLAGRSDAPLDLSWNKNHSCDRFINTEDLRPESCLTQSDGDISAVSSISSADEEVSKITSHQEIFPNTWYTHPLAKPSSISTLLTPNRVISTPPASDNSTNSDILRRHVVNSPVKNGNPFSIDSILGTDSSESCDENIRDSEPALVYSSYMAAISGSVYSRFACVSMGGILQQPMTSTPSKKEAPESLLTAKDLFWCHKCNSFCLDKLDAERHRQIHSYRGDTCSLKRLLFKEHGYVTTHGQTGYLDRIQCGLCEKVVANCFFIKHMNLHDGHICEVCDHEFATNSKLQDHMNIHSGRFSFSCKVCDRTFAKKSSLTQHMRYHREYKHFVCRFCSKSFNSKYTCTVHERIHTGETPFKCEKPGCDRGFPQKIQLKLHMATHKKRGELWNYHWLNLRT